MAAHARLGLSMEISDDRVHAAANRVLRTWSLIKMVPGDRLSRLRALLMDMFCKESHLTEDELVVLVLGLKHLHRDGQGA